jgi:site-specific recombinase XerD
MEYATQAFGTICSHLAMKGATAISIKELAGHQHLTTTQRYMHLSPAERVPDDPEP